MTNEEHDIFMARFNIANKSDSLIQSFKTYQSLLGAYQIGTFMNHIENELHDLVKLIYK